MTSVLKFGGSLITRRDQPVSYDRDTTRRLVEQLAQFGHPVALTHGLGSFGRAYLPLYRSNRIPADQRALARTIQTSLRSLHELLIDELLAVGVDAVSLDGETIFALRDGAVSHYEVGIARYHLEQGRTPVVFGGTVRDEVSGYAILSSDVIAERLAEGLSAERLIWATDVDGVFAASDHSVIPSLHEGNRELMWRQEYDDTDATGGMSSKVDASLRVSRCGVESVVFNGARPGALLHALRGEPTGGTEIDKAAA